MAFRWKRSHEKYRRVSSWHFVSIERVKSSVNITLIFTFRCKFAVHSSNGEVEAILVGEIVVFRDNIRLNDRSAVKRIASYRSAGSGSGKMICATKIPGGIKALGRIEKPPRFAVESGKRLKILGTTLSDTDNHEARVP